MGQEPWDGAKVKEYISGQFGVDFPVFDKVEVNGTNCTPIFNYLRQNSSLYNAETGLTKVSAY
jgi:glutathione peroxidase